jgi:hypothetical protein
MDGIAINRVYVGIAIIETVVAGKVKVHGDKTIVT